MSTLSSANVTDVNLVLKERTHMRLCLNMLIFTHNLGNWLIATVWCWLWTLDITGAGAVRGRHSTEPSSPTRTAATLPGKLFSPAFQCFSNHISKWSTDVRWLVLCEHCHWVFFVTFIQLYKFMLQSATHGVTQHDVSRDSVVFTFRYDIAASDLAESVF